MNWHSPSFLALSKMKNTMIHADVSQHFTTWVETADAWREKWRYAAAVGVFVCWKRRPSVDSWNPAPVESLFSAGILSVSYIHVHTNTTSPSCYISLLEVSVSEEISAGSKSDVSSIPTDDLQTMVEHAAITCSSWGTHLSSDRVFWMNVSGITQWYKTWNTTYIHYIHIYLNIQYIISEYTV